MATGGGDDRAAGTSNVLRAGKAAPRKPMRTVGWIDGCAETPECGDRQRLTASLLRSLGLAKCMHVVEKAPMAMRDDLLAFHDPGYVHVLECFAADEEGQLDEEELAQFGLGFDADWFPGLWRHVLLTCGGSLRAADLVRGREVRIALHWQGGRHHAQRHRAGGFCYVNDIAIAARRLLTSFSKVVVVDLDVHHGNGTERAFLLSAKVLHISVHHFAPGFYPGSGRARECGAGSGLNATVNLPLREGLGGEAFTGVVQRLATAISRVVDPADTALIVVCGTDSLAGDPRGAFNVEPKHFARAVSSLLEVGLPTVLLGGGGYDPANAARAWALCAAHALFGPDGLGDADDVPADDEFLPRFKDGGFRLGSSLRQVQPDHNDAAYLEEVVAHAEACLMKLRWNSTDSA